MAKVYLIVKAKKHERAKKLAENFMYKQMKDKKVDWFNIGGTHSGSLLSHLDQDLLRKCYLEVDAFLRQDKNVDDTNSTEKIIRKYFTKEQYPYSTMTDWRRPNEGVFDIMPLSICREEVLAAHEEFLETRKEVTQRMLDKIALKNGDLNLFFEHEIYPFFELKSFIDICGNAMSPFKPYMTVYDIELSRIVMPDENFDKYYAVVIEYKAN